MPNWCKWLCVLAAALLAAPAFGDLPFAPRFQWEAPTEFEDGTALDPIADLKEFRLYCDPTIVMQTIPIDPPYEWQAPAGMFPPGDYSCYMTAVASDDHGGLESGPSNTKTFTVEQARPAPIIIFEIQ